MYGDVVVRPVDRRENYVKRCVGLPGDTLEIRDAQVYIDGKPLENPEDMQLNYLVQTTGPYITEDMFRELGISKDDQAMVTNESLLMEMGLTHRDAQGRLAPTYDLPLTKKMFETLSANKKLHLWHGFRLQNVSGFHQKYFPELYTALGRTSHHCDRIG